MLNFHIENITYVIVRSFVIFLPSQQRHKIINAYAKILNNELINVNS
ncbi:hypothetical protein AC16_4413 [Escherichia coli 2-177-06_S3_C2]|nr:hypothetical protein AC16_4413 [Escherichia coli 2-177-06_S3_C2]